MAPLAGLLACSRPARFWEWLWLGVAGAWLLLWLRPSGDLPEQLLRSAGVLVAGAFVGLSLAWRAPAFRRAMAALGLATVAVLIWAVALRIDWADLKIVVARDVARSLSEVARQVDSAGSAETGDLLRQMADTAPTLAALTPALLFLNALAGVLLSWILYHRIARQPFGAPAAPFSTFRFSDQAVWLPVAGLALLLVPAPPALRDVGANLALVAVALYAARGLAVVRAGSGRLPRVAAAFAAVVALFLLPFVVGGLTLLGLADTWLDFRRRASPATGGFDR